MTKLAQCPVGDPMVMLAPDVCDDVIIDILRRNDLTLDPHDQSQSRIVSLWDVVMPIDAPLYPELGEDLHPVRLIANHDIREVRHNKVGFDDPLFYLSTVEDMVMLSSVPNSAYPLRHNLTGKTWVSVSRKWDEPTGGYGSSAVCDVTYRTACGMLLVTPDMCRSIGGGRNFDYTFARDPELALYEAGFDLSCPFEGQMLVTPNTLLELEVLAQKRLEDPPLFRRTLVLYLLALWRSPNRLATTAQRVILLLSIDDAPTQSLLSLVRQQSNSKGLDVIEVFIFSRYGLNTPPSPEEIVKRLEHALGNADPRTTLLAVHQGSAFALAEKEITAALKIFVGLYPSIRLGLDTRKSIGSGESFGLWFDQPSELNVVFNTLSGD